MRRCAGRPAIGQATKGGLFRDWRDWKGLAPHPTEPSRRTALSAARHQNAKISQAAGMEQGLGLGDLAAQPKPLHDCPAPRRVEFGVAQLGEPVSQTPCGEELGLGRILHVGSGIGGYGHQSVEGDIHGDAGGAGLQQRVGSEVMRPVGAHRALGTSMAQSVGGVSVVDHHHRPGGDGLQRRAQPLRRPELDLDARTCG